MAKKQKIKLKENQKLALPKSFTLITPMLKNERKILSCKKWRQDSLAQSKSKKYDGQVGNF